MYKVAEFLNLAFPESKAEKSISKTKAKRGKLEKYVIQNYNGGLKKISGSENKALAKFWQHRQAWDGFWHGGLLGGFPKLFKFDKSDFEKKGRVWKFNEDKIDDARKSAAQIYNGIIEKAFMEQKSKL